LGPGTTTFPVPSPGGGGWGCWFVSGVPAHDVPVTVWHTHFVCVLGGWGVCGGVVV
jgi:hypothetical protein